MKTTRGIQFNRLPIALFIAACMAMAGTQLAGAAGVTTWSGGGANQNWSSALNWTTVGGGTPPGAGDAVIFRATGGGSSATVNNIVDGGFTDAIGSLLFTNEAANLFHTTQIPSGNTLAINGPITIGGTNQPATYTVTGGGTLRGGTGASVFTIVGGNTSNLTNDLSGLNNFIWNAGGAGANFYVGTDPGFSSGGVLKLAAVSNNITATTMYIANNNNGGSSTLNLGGGTNIINANTVEIGGSKTTGTLQFNSSTGGVRWRAANGVSGGSMELAGTPGHSGTSSYTFNGTANLKGHPLDMLFSTLTIANRGGRGSSGTSVANFSFDTGVVSATNIAMAVNTSGGSAATGTLSVGGGTLNVFNNLSLVNCGGAAGTGTLIVTNGGTVKAGNILKTTANGTGAISVTNATLAIGSPGGAIGTTATPIDTINLENATLRLKLDANISAASVVATTINTNGANVVIIDSIANASGTVTFPIINYLTSANDPFPTLTLAGVPAGYTGAVLSDDTANQTITLTITAPNAYPLTWTGITNSVVVGVWDTNKTRNWTDGSSAHAYADPDPVTFDDTASTGIVTLVTTNAPASVTVNNNSLNYTLNGAGKITGSCGITKSGNATLTLADTGGDDFTGNITLNGGTLIFDNTNSAISGGLTINGGATAQLGNNDAGGNLPSGALDDEGTLVFARADNLAWLASISGGGSVVQAGGGTLTLSAANSFTGPMIASKGKLALTVANAISASSGLLVSNATFDVSAIAGPVGLNDFSVTNATINLNVPASLQAPIAVNTFESDGTAGGNNVINVTSLPGIALYPVTVTLIQSTNAMTLANGHFNFALGTLPTASPSYAGALSESGDGTAILLTLTAGPIGTRASVTWNGTNNVSATTNWTDNLNWQLPGVPGAADNVVFNNSAVGTDSTTVNNLVNANFNVATLTYNQNGPGNFHVTEIPGGVTLNVSGAVTVGGLPAADGTLTSTYLTGGGTFAASGATFNVNNFGSSSSGSLATLDLSGLSYFIFNSSIGTMNIANATSGNRFGGLFIMAAVSNNVTAGTINFMQNNVSNGGNGSSGLQFGAGTNVVNVGTFNIVGGKNSGTVKFVSGAPATAGVRIRGVTGNSDDTARANITIAVRNSTGTGTTTGNLSLNGNAVDIKANTLTMGQDTQSGGNGANGTLSFDNGVVDVTDINLGIAGNAAVTSAVGTINIGSGAGSAATLIIGSGGLSMVNQTAGNGGAGSLNINGGTVICSNSIVKSTTAGTATISLADGTLNLVSGVIGTLGAPIDTLNLTDNGTLDTRIELNVVAGVTNICATAINASGVTTINIASFAGLTGATQIPLISYANNSSPIAGLALGTHPAGYTIGNGGALIDNTANQTIDILVTPPAPIIWKGIVGSVLNGDWDTATLNWLNAVTPVAFANGDYVQFDDTASSSTVTLTTTVSPGGLNVNNNALTYAFTGSGKISGNVALVKQGAGSLILDNSGSNDFSAGVNIAGGTVQVGNNDANGNLPATGNIIDNGTLVLDRADSSVVVNAISGAGNVAQIGVGTNRLGAINSYSGTTLISSGMIIATSANAGLSSIGTTDGACTVTNGGTLDIENPTANSICFTNLTDNGGKPFYIAGTGVGGNGVIVNNGTANQQNAFQAITLTANATVGGPARWDMRVPNGQFQPILDLQGFTLTKTGSNQMSMVALIVTNGGNIVINSGILSFETVSSNSATPITVNAGGVLGHFREQAGFFTAPITLNGGSIRDLNGTPGSTNDSPITLTANSTLDLNVNSTDLVRLNGTISESGGSFGLTKTNVGSYSLSAANTYSGATMIVGGTLILVDGGSIARSKSISIAAGTTFDASQRTDQTLTLNAGQTLSGFGTVTGLVTTAGSSTVAPGLPASVGTLTFANNTTLSGTNLMKVGHAAGATNDVLSVNGALALGGVLTISTVSTPVAGDTFTLFKATGGIAGSFAVTNLPAIPGLGWDTTNLASGVLSLFATVNPTPTNITASVSGNLLTLSWPADHTGWRLEVQTNSPGAGLNPAAGAWSTVAGSFSVNSMSFPVDATNGNVFYRMVYP